MKTQNTKPTPAKRLKTKKERTTQQKHTKQKRWSRPHADNNTRQAEQKKNFQSISSTMMTKTKNGKINAFLRLILGKRTLTYSNRNAACRFNLPRLAGRSYFFYPHVANSQAQRLIVSRPNIQVTDDDKAAHEPIKKMK